MATTTTHAQIGIVDSKGNVNVIYPITTGADVSITRTSNANIPTTATTAQKLANALGALAFKNVADIISTNGAATSTTATWSSSVINSKLTELSSNLIGWKSFYTNTTIAASSSAQIIIPINITISKDEYSFEPLGIPTIRNQSNGANCSLCCAYDVYIDDDRSNIILNIRNYSNSQAIVTVGQRLLFIQKANATIL